MEGERRRWAIGNRRATAPAVPEGNGAGTSVRSRRPLFREEVMEFQQHNRQWGRVVPLQPLSTRLMVWCVIATASGVIAFLFLAQYARKEVATGYLAPVSGTAKVFASQPGTISAVYVAQGETVEKGQPLLAIETSQIAINGEDVNTTILNSLDQQKKALTRNIAEEVQRTASEQQRLTAQIQQHETVLGDLDAQMAVQRARIAIMVEDVAAGGQLRSKGLVSEVDQRHRVNALLEQRQSLISLKQQVTVRQGELSETRFNLAQLPFVQGDRIQLLRNDLSATQQRIAEVNGRGAYIVRAPIGGRISSLQASEGQQSDPRHPQLQIVPVDSPLQAELFIPVRAIGFVAVGQDVRVLFDAFPYQRFGTFHGRIIKVSQTVLLASDVDLPVALKEPAYTATVALDRPDVLTHGKKIPLQPDMLLRADIILEKHTLANWILDPLRHLKVG
ncbi:MAG: rane fusion protein [Acetobacteraceae bacterium]|nr:rane fusion protein [Acetobacteraceae bacterium]